MRTVIWTRGGGTGLNQWQTAVVVVAIAGIGSLTSWAAKKAYRLFTEEEKDVPNPDINKFFKKKI